MKTVANVNIKEIRYYLNVSIPVGHVIKFHKARLYKEFDHLPTGIYIQVDTLK
jgi:hypothetical protein